MPADNDHAVTELLQYFNAHDIDDVMRAFCPNEPAIRPPPLHPDFPCLGITDHGPAFFGQAGVRQLFGQLFQSFPDMKWTQLDRSQRLTAPGQVGIQMTVTGSFQALWFGHASGHASKPLSQLKNPTGLPLGRKRALNDGVPAFSVFTFNDQHLIRQLQIYLDRYAMMQSITPLNGWDPEADAHDAPHAPPPPRGRIDAPQGRRVSITIDD
jgi:hypothetical protein